MYDSVLFHAKVMQTLNMSPIECALMKKTRLTSDAVYYWSVPVSMLAMYYS